MSDWTLARLQRDLRERAEGVDAVVHEPLLAPTAANYRRWLCSLYGFLHAFEIRFAFTHHLEINFIQQRIRSRLLSSDLLALGLTEHEYMRLAQRITVPEFTHPLDGLGWLFVIERISLQLETLRRRLEHDLAHELAVGGSYLRMTHDEAELYWKTLGAMIDRWITREGDEQRLETAARDALDALESWARAASSPTVHVEMRSA